MIPKLLTLGLRWYIDPGHGWLAVPMRTLLDSGAAGQISTCSYMSRGGRVAYLEEDCDAPRFLRAINVSFEEAGTFPDKLLEGQCFIRRLPAFAIPEGDQA